MKKILAIALLFVAAKGVNAQATDTLGFEAYSLGTETLYESPNGGYAFGNNGYADKAKAQTFQHNESFVVDNVLLKFGAVEFNSQDSSSSIVVNFYSNTGLGVTTFSVSDTLAPDTIRASVTVPVYQLIEGDITSVDFSDDTLVYYPGELFTVGVDLTQLAAGDTVGLFSTTDGDGDVNSVRRAWEFTANNNWIVVAQPAYSWDLEVDLAIFVEIDENDPAGIFQNKSDFEFSLYPNPTADYLNIGLSSVNQEKARIEVLSVDGSLLLSEQQSSQGAIDVSGLTNGLYLLRLQIDDGVSVKQFVVQKN